MDTCLCCTCVTDHITDPSCRDHGWYGQRPCEVHAMAGRIDDDGNMPYSVQIIRARRQDVVT